MLRAALATKPVASPLLLLDNNGRRQRLLSSRGSRRHRRRGGDDGDDGPAGAVVPVPRGRGRARVLNGVLDGRAEEAASGRKRAMSSSSVDRRSMRDDRREASSTEQMRGTDSART
jgi:hypothetical protein